MQVCQDYGIYDGQRLDVGRRFTFPIRWNHEGAYCKWLNQHSKLYTYQTRNTHNIVSFHKANIYVLNSSPTHLYEKTVYRMYDTSLRVGSGIWNYGFKMIPSWNIYNPFIRPHNPSCKSHKYVGFSTFPP